MSLRFKATASGSASISPVVKIPEDCLVGCPTLMWLWLLRVGKHQEKPWSPVFSSFTMESVCLLVCACAFSNTNSPLLREPARHRFYSPFCGTNIKAEIL